MAAKTAPLKRFLFSLMVCSSTTKRKSDIAFAVRRTHAAARGTKGSKANLIHLSIKVGELAIEGCQTSFQAKSTNDIQATDARRDLLSPMFLGCFYVSIFLWRLMQSNSLSSENSKPPASMVFRKRRFATLQTVF